MLKTLKSLIDLMGFRKKRLYISLILSFIDGFFIVVPILMAFDMAGSIPELFPGTTTPLTTERVIRDTIFMVICVLIRIVIRYSTLRLFSGVGYEAMCDQRKELGKDLRSVSMGYYNRKNLGDLVATVTSDAGFIEIEGMGVVEKMAVGIPSIIVGLMFLLYFDYRIAIMVTLLMATTWFAYRHLASTQDRLDLDRQQLVAEVTEDTVEFVNGLSVLKTYNMTDKLFYKTKAAFRKLRELSVKVELSHLPPSGIFQACFRVITAVIIFMAGCFAIKGEISWPAAFLLMIASLTMFSGAEMMGIYSIFAKMTQKSVDRINQVKDIPKMDNTQKDETLDCFDITFDHVSFAYETVPVLKDVSFLVPEKTMTALVGLSGSGKSTIANLAARFWDVSKGKVLIGGRDVKLLSYENLLENISFVFQDVFLFDDTIANNIRIGRPDAGSDEIVEAARRAGCHDFIVNLDQGYDTAVGEAGARLSGGEKQRISIARALLKDAPIVLLDEVTANVDVENEQRIQLALQELLKDRTVIIIAHKLSTIRNVDQILVIENGQISQKGCHDDLIEKEGLYKRLWEMQYETSRWRV
ncbi:MAG: ABC transporter ATP-binding protein [Lachnospiraceae bacterium]